MPHAPFSDLLDQKYPPGSPERAQFELRYQAYSARRRRIARLTDWLGWLPPRWTYETEIVDGEVYRHQHGPGLIAAWFWSQFLEVLSETPKEIGLGQRLGRALYMSCDMLACFYFDDVYVPTLADVRAHRAGHRRVAWRRRQAQAGRKVDACLAHLRAQGQLDPEEA